MSTSPLLSESLENYLEAILHIVEEKHAAKPRDIAKALSVSNSSVTGALRTLADKALINYAPFEVITLTEQGAQIANNIVKRHKVFHDFFVNILAIEEEEADEVACRMEHAVTPVVLERFTQFLDYVERSPIGGARWTPPAGFARKMKENE